MIWAVLYFLCGFITTIVAIKTNFCQKDDADGPPVIALFLLWPFFLFILAIIGAWLGSEWLFHWIADQIPIIKIKRSDK